MHLDARLACGNVRGEEEDRLCEDGGDGGEGGVGDFRRLCVIRRSKPAHFPNLRNRHLTWSPRGAQNPDLPALQHHRDSAQRTSSDCTALLGLGIVDIRRLVYPNACQWSRQLRAVMYFAGPGHGRCPKCRHWHEDCGRFLSFGDWPVAGGYSDHVDYPPPEVRRVRS